MRTTDDFATESRRRGLDDYQNPDRYPPLLVVIVAAGASVIALVVVLAREPDPDPVAAAKPARAAVVVPCSERP